MTQAPPPPPRPGFGNPLLLLTLSAVAASAADPSASLPRLTGLDALELTVALAVAERRGFVIASGPGYAVTLAGLEWAKAELAPFLPLVSATTTRRAA